MAYTAPVLSDSDLTFDDSKKGALAAIGLGAAAGTLAIATPARADVTEVSGMVSSLGTLAGVALAVALVPVGIYYAFKIVRRVMI